MKRYPIFLRVIIAALASVMFAACGGSGGSSIGSGNGDGNGGTPAVSFAATNLAAVGGASFSVGVAINDGNEVVGISDGGSTAPTTMKAVAWTVTDDGATVNSTVAQLAIPFGAGAYSAAYAVNAGGAIVGELETAPGGSIVPAFWPNRTASPAQVVLLQLGTAGGGSAYGINTSGRVVGELENAGIPTAATWATSTDAPAILTASTGMIASSAYFINDLGEIVGELTDAAGTHAVLWRQNATTGVYDAAPILLPTSATLNGDSIALAINNTGTIVGEITDGDGLVHAARWIPETANTFILADLGPVGNDSSAAGINDGGRAVGHVQAAPAGTSTANTWAAGSDTASPVSTELGNSQAYAVNTAGWIVGIDGAQALFAVPR